MPITNREILVAQRTADQLIRRAGGWDHADVNAIASRVWKDRPQNSSAAYLQYRNIATQAVRMARSAQTLQVNPNLTVLNLPVDPGIRGNQRRYAYRVVVVVRDGSGNERQSTAVTVRSTANLTGGEVQEMAIAQVQQNSPAYPDQSIRIVNLNRQWTIDAYIVAAGVKR